MDADWWFSNGGNDNILDNSTWYYEKKQKKNTNLFEMAGEIPNKDNKSKQTRIKQKQVKQWYENQTNNYYEEIKMLR